MLLVLNVKGIAESNMNHLLEISNISKLYKNGKGIKNISFSIDSGEIYGVLGEFGSGKTTIMRIVAGDLQADCGNALFEGCNLEDKIFQNVKSLFSPPILYNNLTASDHLKLAAKYLKKIDKQDVDYLLNLTRLSDYVIEPVKEYTEGMKLRLRLALILLASTKLVILDEPDFDIDMESLYILRIILLEQVKKGISFLISSKNTLQMELMCDKVAIFRRGQLVAKSPMKKILLKYFSLENYYNYSLNANNRL